jgi:alanyl-tRNA synthetase
MTERLYYTDATCTRFSGRIVEQLVWQDQPSVLLDRTAFYPMSGGQPADRGVLGGVAVLDVVVREGDGEIVHVLEAALEDGDKVEGEIDWPRRFDHMQQHTGQHILSAAFEQLCDADTVGFHLGAEVSTLDVNVPRLDSSAIAPVEGLANQVIWENREVSTYFVDQDHLETLPLRRPAEVEGPVRIVEIGGSMLGSESSFDLNPCGGTHVARTGEIGLIKILRFEYRGDETRVEFLCGNRALRDYRAKNEVIGRLSGLLTVSYGELDKAVERLQGEAKQLRQNLRRARKQLLRAEAAELAKGATVYGSVPVVWRVWKEREPEELRALAQELAQRFGMVALLAGVGERTHLCFTSAEEVDWDVSSLLREACAQLGGKGGGQPHLAQGSAPTIDLSRVETTISGILENS